MPVLIFLILVGFAVVIALIAGMRSGQKKNYYYRKSLSEEIRQLEMLRDRGTISEEEFSSYKKKLLMDDDYMDK